jgi:hypothetical protein
MAFRVRPSILHLHSQGRDALATVAGLHFLTDGGGDVPHSPRLPNLQIPLDSAESYPLRGEKAVLSSQFSVLGKTESAAAYSLRPPACHPRPSGEFRGQLTYLDPELSMVSPDSSRFWSKLPLTSTYHQVGCSQMQGGSG